jgi:pectinesterase
MSTIYSCKAQKVITKNYFELNWKDVATKMPKEWYGSSEAKSVADSVLKYQTAIGGWPKNNNFHKGMNQDEWSKIQSSGIGATFDNGATITEMIFLSNMYGQTKNQIYFNSFERAFKYILKAQYDNGGWPQFFPIRQGKTIAYNAHITFNDNAMVNILKFLKDVLEEKSEYASMPIDKSLIENAKIAFDKGINCILKTQIIKNGKPTVWCAQHDKVTLEPANARAYELASFSGGESVGIALLLMEMNNPSKEVVNAIVNAIAWFENHKIEGISLKEIINSEGQKDIVVVQDKYAHPIWARFYDLESNEPFFCNRDGVKRKTFAELEYNRRNGYDWYTSKPESLLEKYPEWKKKNILNN